MRLLKFFSFSLRNAPIKECASLIARAADQLRELVDSGKPILGICNGFQILVETGLLPDGKVGERGWNMKRAVNNKLGLTAANDKLPKALLEPLSTGGTEGFVPDIRAMLIAYDAARGWDEKTGYPTREKLIELGLDDVAKDLWG